MGGGLKFTEFEAFRIRIGFEVGGMVTGKRKTPYVKAMAPFRQDLKKWKVLPSG